jgi:surfeit locus 1 family protein
MQRRDLKLAVLALLVAAVCVGMGIWQIKRLKQRRAANALLAARWALPPLAVRDRSVSADSARQRRVTARGVYDFSAEQTWPGRSYQGTPGVALITPLRLPDGSAVLVDRGWVPSPDAYHVDQMRYREPDTVTVAGLALIPPRGRGDVSTRGYLPFIIQLETPGPPPERGLPRRWPEPVLDEGSHLSYIIQWFSFAMISLVGTAALLRSRK